MLLIGLVGCGEDSGGPNRRPGPETTTPPLVIEGSVPGHLHRTLGNKVYSAEETLKYLLNTENQHPSYRTIPLLGMDDEGSFRNVRTLGDHKGRPGSVCGIGSGLSLRQRLENCSEINGTRSIWEAALLGAAGEADWKLVARNANGHEIWMDTRTQMLWADASSGTNWCRASGNTEESCNDLNGSLDNRICRPGIAGIDNIIWRLPTRNDFLQADLDGMRFVLPINEEEGYWTATLDSRSVLRDKAWVYESAQGTLKSSSFEATHPIRCIGASP